VLLSRDRANVARRGRHHRISSRLKIGGIHISGSSRLLLKRSLLASVAPHVGLKKLTIILVVFLLPPFSMDWYDQVSFLPVIVRSPDSSRISHPLRLSHAYKCHWCSCSRRTNMFKMSFKWRISYDSIQVGVHSCGRFVRESLSWHPPEKLQEGGTADHWRRAASVVDVGVNLRRGAVSSVTYSTNSVISNRYVKWRGRKVLVKYNNRYPSRQRIFSWEYLVQKHCTKGA
jgi:hypothetical protein